MRISSPENKNDVQGSSDNEFCKRRSSLEKMSGVHWFKWFRKVMLKIDLYKNYQFGQNCLAANAINVWF